MENEGKGQRKKKGRGQEEVVREIWIDNDVEDEGKGGDREERAKRETEMDDGR